MTRVVIEIEEDLDYLQAQEIISEFEEIVAKENYSLYDSYHSMEDGE